MEYKKCNVCKIEKILDEFHWKNKIKKIKNCTCKDCRKIIIRDHYQKNKQSYIKKAEKSKKIFFKNVRDFLFEYFNNNPCVDCGETDIRVLEFDHVRGIKENSICTMIRSQKSLKTIKKEIEKCEVRCANCHRKKTVEEFGWWSSTKNL